MCYLLIAINQTSQYPFILAANRDEFYHRLSAPLHYWQNKPQILGGKDLVQGGSWMALTPTGKFAVITNFRENAAPVSSPRSRGLLVTDYLKGSESPAQFATRLQRSARQYAGFNLIFGHLPAALYYYSNRQQQPPTRLTPGIYALSNHFLDTPWPKVKLGKKAFSTLIHGNDLHRSLFTLLQDQTKAEKNELPNTGIEPELEHLLSSIFIQSDTYGSRCSSVITVEATGALNFSELTHNVKAKTKSRPICVRLQLPEPANGCSSLHGSAWVSPSPCEP